MALHRSEASVQTQWKALSQIREMGVEMRQVGPDELRALVPSVSHGYNHGLYSPSFQHALDPQGLIARLVALFRARGGELFREEVRRIERQGKRVTGVVTADGEIAGDSVLVACGTGSAVFAKAMGEAVPHQAVGGYHVMLNDPGVTLDRPVLPIDFRFAITPMGKSIRLAGIYEFGGQGRPFRKDLVDSMLAHLGRAGRPGTYLSSGRGRGQPAAASPPALIIPKLRFRGPPAGQGVAQLCSPSWAEASAAVSGGGDPVAAEHTEILAQAASGEKLRQRLV